MKNGDMNSFTAYLFRATVQTLISKEIIPKGAEAARLLKMTYNQYKNICSERTALTPKQWEIFIKTIEDLDQHEYQWVVKKLLGE